MASNYTPQRSVVFPVSELNIKLDTNVGKIETFKRGMVQLPKMPNPPNMTNEFPFFTRNVRYPSYIQSADWKTRYEFFFNRDIFVETLRKEIENDPSIFKSPQIIETESTQVLNKLQNENDDPYSKKFTRKSKRKQQKIRNKLGEEWLLYTEKHNIMITLRSIFPISETFAMALTNSYDHNLMQKNNGRILYDLDITSAFNFFGFMHKFGILHKESEDYFLNVNGKRYEIENVTWENDIVNHPVYSKFLEAQHTTSDEVGNFKLSVSKSAKEFEDNLNYYLKTLTDRSKRKKRYIELFKITSGTKLDNDEDQFKNFDDAKFAKYIYKDPDNVYDDIKVQLIKDEFEYEGDKQREDLLREWNSEDISQEHDSMIAGLKQELKSIETFTGLIASIKKLKSPRSDAKYRNAEIVADRVITNLEALAGNEASNGITGKEAADAIISIKDELDNYAASTSSNERVSIIDGNYKDMYKKLTDLAIRHKAALIVKNFVLNSVPMNLKTAVEVENGKSIESKSKVAIVDFIKLNFSAEKKMNDALTNSVNDIYEPSRKTTNSKLYCLIRQIKTGEMPDECDISKDKRASATASIFTQIYNYYMTEYPDRHTFRIIQPYLYTGVDQVRVSSSEKNTDSFVNTQEIYVRLDLVDAEKLKSVSRAPCKLYDKIIAEEYKFLTSKQYNDDGILNFYRNFDFDSDVSKPDATKVENKNAKIVGGGLARNGASRRLLRNIRINNRTIRERHHI